MKVGAARADITPPLGLPMDGYGARVSGATGTHDPLAVRVIVAEGDDGTAVALVVADLLFVNARLQASVAERVRAATGIERDRLQLVGTHTHSGPAFDAPSPAEDAIADRMVDAVERAWGERRLARVALGVGRVEGIGANRRPNGGPVDDRVTVARFDDDAGQPIATLVNYGCHPTTLGPDNLRYSADYPGVACRALDDAIGGIAVFTTGAQGDVNPGGYSPEGSMVGIVVPWRTFESAERYGRLVAECAAAVHAGLAPAVTDGPDGDRVWGAAEVVELDRRDLPDRAVAEAALAAALRAEAAIRNAGLSADAIHHAKVAAAYTDLIAMQAADPERDGPVRLRVSALGIGPLTHVGIQGELFVALGQQIRERLGGDRTCIAVLCDGTVGYIPTADAFAEGGYEPNASVLRPGGGELLVEAVVALVERSTAATLAR
jgi:neutral ceramidase